MEHFFSPSSSEHLRSDAHQSQVIGGGCRIADVDRTQTIGRDTAKLLGEISPHPPRVSAPLIRALNFNLRLRW